MILAKNKQETDCFLDINNDIYRIQNILNSSENLKRLLVYTDKKPLEDYDVKNRASYEPESIDELDLRDSVICRVPLLPANEEQSSLIVISLISGESIPNAKAMLDTLAIDIFTPGNQWIIDEGIRPLIIAHYINNLINNNLSQTDGVKYRLTNFVNAQLSDGLLGYRMIFDSVIDD